MKIIDRKKEEQVLDHKRRSLKRWAIALVLLAVISCFALAGIILDRIVLKGARDGGFAINYNKVETKLAWIGAQIRDIDETISEELGLPSTSGVLINDVDEDSPADKAGLERGDVILAFDGTQIQNSLQMQDQILKYQPGDTVKVVVDKADSGKRILYLELGADPADKKPPKDKNRSIMDFRRRSSRPRVPRPTTTRNTPNINGPRCSIYKALTSWATDRGALSDEWYCPWLSAGKIVS